MSVKKHITADEEVLDYCTTDGWAWVCTDKRVLKYRTNRNGEQLDDISLEEITGTSLTTTGQSDKLRGYTILSAIGSVVFVAYSLSTAMPLLLMISVFTPIIPYMFHKRWQRSSNGYFELRGTGLIRQEPEKWKIQSDTNPEEVRSFIQTVRDNI